MSRPAYKAQPRFGPGLEAGGVVVAGAAAAAAARTLEVDGSTFEAVPELLIVKAGLAAAASLLKA